MKRSWHIRMTLRKKAELTELKLDRAAKIGVWTGRREG